MSASAAPSVFALDSDTLSFLLRARHNPDIVAAVRQALAANARVIISPVAYYEVRSGLEQVRARVQLRQLEALIARLGWHDLDRDDWVEAAVLRARVLSRGRVIGDGDILIAAHARRRGATVVTHNVRHFAELGVDVVDWKRGG